MFTVNLDKIENITNELHLLLYFVSKAINKTK
jgi:hypothetical protein